MRCPYCAGDDDRVVDSRAVEDGSATRRRRECLRCHRRYSTYERVEPQPLVVRKRDGRAEPFDAAKLRSGMAKATLLPIGHDALQRGAARVEAAIRAQLRPEVTSEQVGEEVLTALRSLDEVAYVRFASVYKEFRDVAEFVDEISTLAKPKPPTA